MPKVLIADPTTQIREVLAATFTMFGWEYIEAGDGEETIERARKERPDVVLLEVVLPRRDGWEVLKSLCEVPETRDIPVIILSGWPNVHLDQRLGGVRPAAILTKPFRPLTLLGEVESVFPNHSPSISSEYRDRLDESIVIGSLGRNGAKGGCKVDSAAPSARCVYQSNGSGDAKTRGVEFSGRIAKTAFHERHKARDLARVTPPALQATV